MNTGQPCAGSKRFIVHEAVYDRFTETFAAAMTRLVAGDPLDQHTTLGPLVSETAVKAVLDQIERAVASGARVVTGGGRLDRRGCFVAAMVLEMRPDNPVPGGAVRPGGDGVPRPRRREGHPPRQRHALRPRGELITRDVERARALADQIDAGMVFINSNVLSAPELPFGGVKNSGFGRELSDLGIGEFVNRKLVTLN